MAKGRTFFDSFSMDSEGKSDEELDNLGGEDISSAAETMEYSDDVEDDDNNFAPDDDEANTPPAEVEEEEEKLEKVETVAEAEEDVEDIEDDGAWVVPVINSLAEEGVLYYDPEKEYSSGEEGLIEVVQDTVEKRWNEKVEAIPEDYRSLIDHLAAGKPLDEWKQAMDQFDYSTIDMDDEDNQLNLVVEMMELQGFDEEDINEKIESLKDSGLAAQQREAKIAQKFMIKQTEVKRKEFAEQTKAEVVAKQAKEVAEQEKLRADIFELEEIAGFKLDKKQKQKLYDHITKPVTKDGKTQMMVNRQNPKNQVMAAYFDMMGFDFGDVQKKTETKVSRGLKAAMDRYTSSNAKKTSGSRQVAAPRESSRVPRGIWDANREVED